MPAADCPSLHLPIADLFFFLKKEFTGKSEKLFSAPARSSRLATARPSSFTLQKGILTARAFFPLTLFVRFYVDDTLLKRGAKKQNAFTKPNVTVPEKRPCSLTIMTAEKRPCFAFHSCHSGPFPFIHTWTTRNTLNDVCHGNHTILSAEKYQ